MHLDPVAAVEIRALLAEGAGACSPLLTHRNRRGDEDMRVNPGRRASGHARGVRRRREAAICRSANGGTMRNTARARNGSRRAGPNRPRLSGYVTSA
jgi:hypothetical protein